MGIFRRRSRFSSQLEDSDFSVWQRLREDFSQSSDVIERLARWVGDSRGRLALFGLVTVLVVVALMLVSVLLYGVPGGAEKEFVPVSLGSEVLGDTGFSSAVPDGTVVRVVGGELV